MLDNIHFRRVFFAFFILSIFVNFFDLSTSREDPDQPKYKAHDKEAYSDSSQCYGCVFYTFQSFFVFVFISGSCNNHKAMEKKIYECNKTEHSQRVIDNIFNDL